MPYREVAFFLGPEDEGGLIKTGSGKLFLCLLLSDIKYQNMTYDLQSTRGCWCTPRWGHRADGVVECGLVQEGASAARHDLRQRCGQKGDSARSPPPDTYDRDVTAIEKDDQIL